MSTCKGCLHVEVCKYNDGANAWCKGDCPRFKDKSESVDLPCKVGDRVYVIYTSDKTLKSYIETYGDKITQIKINKGGYHFKCWWGYFHLSDIGKTVFLMREDAEQARAERSVE